MMHFVGQNCDGYLSLHLRVARSASTKINRKSTHRCASLKSEKYQSLTHSLTTWNQEMLAHLIKITNCAMWGNKILPGCPQDMPMICPINAQDMVKISQSYAQKMLKICPSYDKISKTLITHTLSNMYPRDASASKNNIKVFVDWFSENFKWNFIFLE